MTTAYNINSVPVKVFDDMTVYLDFDMLKLNDEECVYRATHILNYMFTEAILIKKIKSVVYTNNN